MHHLPRFVLAFLLTASSATGLLAQTVTNAPNQNNGAVTKTETGIWETPFLWVGLVVFGLALLLLFFKKGQTPIRGRTKSVDRGADVSDNTRK